MKITAIRIRRLVSGPGYNHHAVEAEAEVLDHQDPDLVHEALSSWIDRQLAIHRETDGLQERRDSLREEVHRLQQSTESQRSIIAENRCIIQSHEELSSLAQKHGIDPKGLDDGLPF